MYACAPAGLNDSAAGCDTTPPVIPAAATQDTAVNATLDTLQSQIKQLQNEMRELKDKNKELTLANERHIEQSRRCQCNSRQGWSNRLNFNHKLALPN